MPVVPLITDRLALRTAPLGAAALALAVSTILLTRTGLDSWPEGRSAHIPEAAVASLALLVAAALTAWGCLLCVCAGVVLVARADIAHRVGTLLAPRLFPRLLALTLGTTVALSAAPAHATPLAGGAVAVAAYEAPGGVTQVRDAAAGPTVPLPRWGTMERWTPPPAPALPQAPVSLVTGSRDPRPVSTVTVARGDCLWDLASAHLGPDATPAEIAQHTGIWHELNRAVIGDDPDLLRVGTVLQIPPDLAGSDRPSPSTVE